MAYKCEKCSETNGFTEIVNTIIKLVVIGAVLYIAFTYKSQIESAVKQAVQRSVR